MAEDYPYVGQERQEDRIYLEDYFDNESIEIDKLLYLGLMDSPGCLWLKDERTEKNRTRAYLSLAFQSFKEKAEKENIQSLEAYDKKFSIHYFCREWMDELLSLLKENGDTEKYKEVMKYRKKL